MGRGPVLRYRVAGKPLPTSAACAYGVSQYWAYGMGHYAVSQNVRADPRAPSSIAKLRQLCARRGP